MLLRLGLPHAPPCSALPDLHAPSSGAVKEQPGMAWLGAHALLAAVPWNHASTTDALSAVGVAV